MLWDASCIAERHWLMQTLIVTDPAPHYLYTHTFLMSFELNHRFKTQSCITLYTIYISRMYIFIKKDSLYFCATCKIYPFKQPC